MWKQHSKLLLKDIICQNGCRGEIVANMEEMNAHEAIELFEVLGVECGHRPYLKAILRACKKRVGDWLQLLPCGLKESPTVQ